MAGFATVFSCRFMPLMVLLVFLADQFCFSYTNPDSQKTCGVFYSKDSERGIKTMVGEQSFNIPGVHWTSQSCKRRSTGSLKIEPGCRMRMCNSSNLRGNCELLNPVRYLRSNLSNVFGGSIASVSCTCSKECRCSDIFMKKKSCARAYLEGGCNSCHSMYLELSSSKSLFPEKHVGKVEALRLRKSCNLTLYSERGHRGNIEIIHDEIIEDYNGVFRSYECKCNDYEYVAQIRPDREASAAAFIDVPSNEEDIKELLKNETTAMHPGVLAAFHSYRNGRSLRNAYILVLGTPGSGQESGINLLFGNLYVPQIHRNYSSRFNIHEFHIPTPVDMFGIANSELRIIDTPGLGDTVTPKNDDARVLAILEEFLSTHEDLKHRIPNVVLIFHRVTDNNFSEDSSQFSKMLRGYGLLLNKISDKYYSNIIFVFSDLCNETVSNQLNPNVKLNQFKNVIQSYGLFPRPTIMTVAENTGEKLRLPMVDEHFKLPNGELYPKNLMNKMKLVARNGEDLIGLGVLRSAFVNLYFDDFNFNITISSYPYVRNMDSRAREYLLLLRNLTVFEKKTHAEPKLKRMSSFTYSADFQTSEKPTLNPFQTGEFQECDIGLMIPSVFNGKRFRRTMTSFHRPSFFPFRHLMELKFLTADDNLGEGTSANTCSGFLAEASCSVVFVMEIITLLLTHSTTARFKNDFYDTVKALPVFTKNDKKSEEKWDDFFKTYWTDIISTIGGGGEIHVAIKSGKPCDEDFKEAVLDMVNFAEGMSFLVTGETKGSNKSHFRSNAEYCLSFYGGDTAVLLRNITKIPIEDASLLLDKWKESLKRHPMAISILGLKTIMDVVGQIGTVYLPDMPQLSPRLKLEYKEMNEDEFISSLLSSIRTPKEKVESEIKNPSCLKIGTKILLADMSEKPVEVLRVGDIVLDKSMNPTKVVGVAYEFLVDQKFYGFDNESFFFTNTHLFAGPSGISGESIRLYAKSPRTLFLNNPLMKYLNVSDMDGEENLRLFHFHGGNSLSVKNVAVYEDPQEYPPETPIYFIQVDSPTGTYIGNGYVCRHEIPPVELWPNTMSVLFRLMETESFEKISQLSYNLETMSFLQEVINRVAIETERILKQTNRENIDIKIPHKMMTLKDVDLDDCIGKIYSNPTLSTAGVGLYTKVGSLLAPYLDEIEGGPKIDSSRVGKLQHDLYNVINHELRKYV